MANPNYTAYLIKFNWVPVEPYDPRRNYEREIGQRIVVGPEPVYSTTVTSEFYGSGQEAGPRAPAIPYSTQSPFRPEYTQTPTPFVTSSPGSLMVTNTQTGTPSLITDVPTVSQETRADILPPSRARETYIGPSDIPQGGSFLTREQSFASAGRSPTGIDARQSGQYYGTSLFAQGIMSSRIYSFQETGTPEYEMRQALISQRGYEISLAPTEQAKAFSRALVGNPERYPDTASQAFSSAIEFGITAPSEFLFGGPNIIATGEQIYRQGPQRFLTEQAQAIASKPAARATPVVLGAALVASPVLSRVIGKFGPKATYQVRGYASEFAFEEIPITDVKLNQGLLIKGVGKTAVKTKKGPVFGLYTEGVTLQYKDDFFTMVKTIGKGTTEKGKPLQISTRSKVLSESIGENKFISNEITGQKVKVGRTIEQALIRRKSLNFDKVLGDESLFSSIGASQKVTKTRAQRIADFGIAREVASIKQGPYSLSSVIGGDIAVLEKPRARAPPAPARPPVSEPGFVKLSELEIPGKKYSRESSRGTASDLALRQTRNRMQENIDKSLKQFTSKKSSTKPFLKTPRSDPFTGAKSVSEGSLLNTFSPPKSGQFPESEMFSGLREASVRKSGYAQASGSAQSFSSAIGEESIFGIGSISKQRRGQREQQALRQRDAQMERQLQNMLQGLRFDFRQGQREQARLRARITPLERFPIEPFIIRPFNISPPGRGPPLVPFVPGGEGKLLKKPIARGKRKEKEFFGYFPSLGGIASGRTVKEAPKGILTGIEPRFPLKKVKNAII